MKKTIKMSKKKMANEMRKAGANELMIATMLKENFPVTDEVKLSRTIIKKICLDLELYGKAAIVMGKGKRMPIYTVNHSRININDERKGNWKNLKSGKNEEGK